MLWDTKDAFFISVNELNLEAKCWGPPPEQAPTIILLHEGLGSVSLWKDFPKKLSNYCNCGVFAYSRASYGQSDFDIVPKPLDYMTKEAMNVVPIVLDMINFKQGILLGHSDGASIATIYAGSFNHPNLKGLCLLAPHFFVEASGLESIEKLKTSFEYSDLPKRLAKYHKDPEHTFLTWINAWLDPHFTKWNIEEYINKILVPTLVIQGKDDKYGSEAHIKTLQNRLQQSPSVLLLDDCQHSPHFEQESKTIKRIADFLFDNKCYH